MIPFEAGTITVHQRDITRIDWGQDIFYCYFVVRFVVGETVTTKQSNTWQTDHTATGGKRNGVQMECRQSREGYASPVDTFMLACGYW